MKSDKRSTDALQKCELCEQKMNPAVKIYNHHTRLCKACFDHMEKLPDAAIIGTGSYIRESTIHNFIF